MKTYNIFNKEKEHLYVARVEKTKAGTGYWLHASDDDSWADDIRGTLLLKMTDTGNGISFHKPPKRSMGYPEAEHLRILLHINEINSSDKREPRLKAVAQGETITL